MTVRELVHTLAVENAQELLGEVLAEARRSSPMTPSLPVTPENRRWMIADVQCWVWGRIARKAGMEQRYWKEKVKAEINKKRQALEAQRNPAQNGSVGKDPARQNPVPGGARPPQVPNESKP